MRKDSVMKTSQKLRRHAHKLVDEMSPEKLQALLVLADEDFFTPAEIADVKRLRKSTDWKNWREVRNDV